MIKRIIYLLSIALLMSCSDFLEEYSQDKDYVRSWKDLDELLIGDCYLPVTTYNEQSFVESTGSFISLLGDEMDESQISSFLLNGDGREKTFGYFTWQQRVGQNESYTDYYTENETWTTIYKKINIANNILASVETVPCKSDEERQGVSKVKGEAHFLRAYYYFWLANVYAKPYNPATSATDLCVPIKTSSVVEDTKLKRFISWFFQTLQRQKRIFVLTRRKRNLSIVQTLQHVISSRAAYISICKTGQRRRNMPKR